LEDKLNQIEALRADLSKSDSKNRQLQQQTDQVSDELRNSAIEQKSLALRLKSMEEKMERERRSLQAQSSAQLEQLQRHSRTVLEDRSTSENEAVRTFVDFANSDCHCRFPELTFEEFFPFLRKYFGEMADRESVYEETIADVIRTRQLFGLSASDEIHKKVAALLSERDEMLEKCRQLHLECGEQRARSAELCQSMQTFEGDVVSLRQWEAWAKRVYRLVSDPVSIVLSSDQLRLALEETLLGSVSSRLLVGKLSSLREQKRALVSVGPELMRRRGESRPSLFAVIAVCVAALRLQRTAGLVATSVRETRHSPRKAGHLEGAGRVPRSPLFNGY
jgi:hypothetical protein